MKKKKNSKPYWEMTTEELREATKEFDVPSDTDYGFRPLTPKERAQWNRIKRRPGRPKVGKGAKSVLISVEQGLLENVDAFAKRNNLSRSELFSRGAKTILKAG